MIINGQPIGKGHPPYIIAEMSNNHLQDFSIAVEIIDAAADAGADAIKIQTYTADSLTINCDKPDFVIQDPLWRGKTYYQLYSEIAMPISWTEKLFHHANQRGITLFSSPFDQESVELLETFNCPAYKIASFEAQDETLLQSIAATSKPIIISSGISSLIDIKKSLDALRQAGATDLALLHCISNYPSSVADMNLNCLNKLEKVADIVGLSDHSTSNMAPIMAIAKGATIIEKHLTLDRSLGGPDAEFSLEPDEFKHLVADCKLAWKALGSDKLLNSGKRPGAQHARSVYAVSDIAAGAILTPQNVRLIRPGFGLPPGDLQRVMGKVASVDIERGTALNWSMLEEQN